MSSTDPSEHKELIPCYFYSLLVNSQHFVYSISHCGEGIIFHLAGHFVQNVLFLCELGFSVFSFQATLLAFVPFSFIFFSLLTLLNVSRLAVIVFAGSFPCIIIVLLIYYANCVINSGTGD